jgi:hypothetical protein
LFALAAHLNGTVPHSLTSPSPPHLKIIFCWSPPECVDRLPFFLFSFLPIGKVNGLGVTRQAIKESLLISHCVCVCVFGFVFLSRTIGFISNWLDERGKVERWAENVTTLPCRRIRHKTVRAGSQPRWGRIHKPIMWWRMWKMMVVLSEQFSLSYNQLE